MQIYMNYIFHIWRAICVLLITWQCGVVRILLQFTIFQWLTLQQRVHKRQERRCPKMLLKKWGRVAMRYMRQKPLTLKPSDH